MGEGGGVAVAVCFDFVPVNSSHNQNFLSVKLYEFQKEGITHSRLRIFFISAFRS